jgi:hypothetical protein
MHCTRPDRSRACRFKFFLYSSHKFRAAVGVDRRGQRLQQGELGVGEGHAGVSVEGIWRDDSAASPLTEDMRLPERVHAGFLGCR